jgi:hypothetical protein
MGEVVYWKFSNSISLILALESNTITENLSKIQFFVFAD